MFYEDEESLKLLIYRYEQRIFALVLYLIGGDRDRAYDIAAASFVEAIHAPPHLWATDVFLARLADVAVEKSRDAKVMPSADEFDSMDITAEERESLRIVKIALGKLPFNAKALLLLRDQLHLSYKHISSILKVSEKDAKIQTIEARLRLRKKIEEILSHGG